MTISRRATALAGTLLVGTLLAGCSGPSQAGSAAIVGDTTITLGSVQSRLDAVLQREPAARRAQQKRKLDTVSRQLLSLAVQHRLVARLARHEHLHADPATVDALLAKAGGARQAARGTVLDAAGMRRHFTDKVLLAQFARGCMPTLALTYDYALVRGPREAKRLARRLASNPAAAPQVVESVERGGGAAALGRRVTARAQPRTAATTPLFGLPANTAAAFPAGGASARWVAVLVRKRTVLSDGATRQAREGAAGTPLLSQIGLHLLGAHAAGTDITVSPRYGVWDPLGMRVVASADVATGVEMPVDHPAGGRGAG